MSLTLPQFGIFARGTPAHHFLEFDLRPGFARDQVVGCFRRLRTPDVSAGGVNLVVAFGADVWRTVAPSHAPASLIGFREIAGLRVAARRRHSTTPGCGSAVPRRT